jgi:REP element-mobilizing transposase RayT
LDDRDRQVYLQLLAQVIRVKRWYCLAYCLMNNHVHLLLQTPEGNLSSGMQRLHGGYARAFNARHGRVGHVFQGRYGAVRIESSERLCVAAAYLARNPVEASLCRRPEDWPWSSFHATMEARVPSPSWLDKRRLLLHFDPRPEVAVRRYDEMARACRASDSFE